MKTSFLKCKQPDKRLKKSILPTTLIQSASCLEMVKACQAKAVTRISIPFFVIAMTVNMIVGQFSHAQGFLAEQHINRGVACTSCHQSQPQKEVTAKTCQSCHGEYDKLVKLTDKLEINPHESHLGEPDCTDCHHGHKKSTPACKQCHDFAIQMKY